MSPPVVEDLLFKKSRSSSSAESENTETWIRRAMFSESLDPDESSDNWNDPQAPPTVSRPAIDPRHPDSSVATASNVNNNSRFHIPFHLPHKASFKNDEPEVVATTMICNSRDNSDIEITQGYLESESEDEDEEDHRDNDGSTAATHQSVSVGVAGKQDDLARRIVQPLVVLLEEDTVKHTYRFTNLQLEISDDNPNKNHSRSNETVSGSLDLLAVERGESTLICKLIPTRARSFATRITTRAELEEHSVGTTKEESRSSRKTVNTEPKQEISSEVGWAGQIWRSALIRLLLITLDDANRFRLSRALQLSLSFLTGYESYLLESVVEGLGQLDSDMKSIWKRAFSNRNVSRVIVQALRFRFDFLFHWGTALTWNRPFDVFGQLPIIGAITRFPATENFPTTRNHALASIFRVVLGEGNWPTRVLTGGREGLITDDPNNTAQNLTAESNGFELANRNQYGTHFGRVHTNRFRFEHRLPTDESLVRTFVTTPMSTVTNNGVVHSLRQLAKHWHNMLYQEYGNFAHQRMEQLSPFDTLRTHIPEVLVTLSSLRGRNVWDSVVLGPITQKLQRLPPDTTAERARRLVRKLHRQVVVPVCGGIATVVEPFRSWLDAIAIALDHVEEEAKEVYRLVSSVELGIRIGYDIMSQVSWKVPSDAVLKRAILRYIQRKPLSEKHGITERHIAEALDRTTPRDKRTLIELVQKKQAYTFPAKLLLARVKTLLQRELRRDIMNGAILSLSKGEYVNKMNEDTWYWLESDKKCELYSYMGKNGKKHQFIHVNSGSVKVVTKESDMNVRVRAYVPVAEAISRAQKMFMTIELNHGKKFSYNAFMEFSPLRDALRKLIVVSQMTCEALDNARLNILSEIQRTHEANDDPQNLVVVGGGPSGMITTLHCTENCLVGGGVVKLFEARDSFAKGGSTYERAQIVRLDARWIAMLRYHCGTGFEDVYIPASGETDAQLGNTLPSQGFVEITIKDLENMLHVEISRFWSRGLISVFTDSWSRFDHLTNSLIKLGENLKVGDVILHQLSSDGDSCTEGRLWKVVELVYTKLLGVDDLKVGEEYGVYYRHQQVVLPFRLIGVDLATKEYHFEPELSGITDLRVNIKDLPSVYPAGTSTNAHADVHEVIIQSLKKNEQGRFSRESLLMDTIKKRKFTLHIGKAHVVEAIGKPSDSQVHLRVVTPEPHGVCCMEGLKVSMGMHNFGEKRWGSGILDDIRSLNDNNTRIIGDFTKMVRTAPIVELMYDFVSKDKEWALHFHKLVTESAFPELCEIDPVAPKIVNACGWLAVNSRGFRRPTLQTRFFETGDNFYLGMELPRELDQWKQDLADQLVVALQAHVLLEGKEQECMELQQMLLHSIDRLWYSACLEVIRTGDVYNPGARHRVPQLFVIDSLIPVHLRKLEIGESFRLLDAPDERYELLSKQISGAIVRNIEGYVFKLPKSAKVYRQSNLTRSPDGNQESKVAISTFPVSHYVNHRTMRLGSNGYVFTFAGDEQASPHFMRYSGLTGAGINAMSFNEFLGRANEGVPLDDRFRDFSKETNWSNGEVVTRGTIGNYGDGFLRPGMTYSDCIDYLYSKLIEYQESGQDLNAVLSRDWLDKMAASFVPRGMELNEDFLMGFRRHWQDAVFFRTLTVVQNDKNLCDTRLEKAFRARKEDMSVIEPCSEGFWKIFLSELKVSRAKKQQLESVIGNASCLNAICNQIIDFASQAYIYNTRLPSELLNQPKPVDSVVDDFAVEAQGFANVLTISAAFGAATLAFRLVNRDAADFASSFLGGINILAAFSTMTNVSRYRIRNEEARVVFMEEKFPELKKEVYALMSPKSQEAVHESIDPLLLGLKESAQIFRSTAIYYGYEEPTDFDEILHTVTQDAYSVSKLELFLRYIAQDLIADAYHENSYVQESLVDVYRTVEEMMFLIRERSDDFGIASSKAEELFLFLVKFEDRLEASLQRGPVRWGFVKTRRFAHWDISIVVRYFCSLLWMFIPCAGCSIAPIENQTASVLSQLRTLSKETEKKHLRREIRDVETLYWATREGDIASLIFVSAFLTFVASIVFTVALVFGIGSLTDLAFFSAAASGLGAVLAVFHFVRKLCILVKLWITLWAKSSNIAPHFEEDLRLVRRVTLTQILLTAARLCAASAAAVAFPFSVAENGYSDRIKTPGELPFLIALGAVIAAVGSTVIFLIVEYVVRYKLSTELGPFVCYLFKQEIAEIRDELATDPKNTTDTQQAQNRELWEYTARKFLHKWRFDTVFAADRFGQILQFLQAEMKNASTMPAAEKPLISHR